MSYTDAVHAILAADGTLTGILTGGILLNRDLPRKGISRDSLPSAYNGVILKPLGVVKGRANVPDGGLRDAGAQYTTTRQVIEIYLYQDGDAGWDTLETAADRIYALLQDRAIPDAFKARWVNSVDDLREATMGDACFIRVDYEVVGRKF